MEVINCLKELIDEELDAIAVEAVRLLLEDLEQVAVHELEHQVQPPLPLERLNHFHYRLVLQLV